MFRTRQTPFENLGLINETFPGSTDRSDEFISYFSIYRTQVLFVFRVEVVYIIHVTGVRDQRIVCSWLRSLESRIAEVSLMSLSTRARTHLQLYSLGPRGRSVQPAVVRL